MIEAFWIPLLPPYLVGLGLSWAIEALLTPRPVAPWRRPGAAVAVHVGVWTLAFALELALFRRPYFAVANVLAIELLIVLVSNAKFQALREPFVYPDFEYFVDAIKHPRLYLPFFGMWRAVAAGSGYGGALWAGLTLEESLTASAIWVITLADLGRESVSNFDLSMTQFFAHTLIFGVTGLWCAYFLASRLSVSFNAAEDLQKNGIVASLWAYAQCERVPIHKPFPSSLFDGSLGSVPRLTVLPIVLPDMVVIQSESFFDARRAFPSIRKNLLENFDLLISESSKHGELTVAAWGANTVRSEFAFLSGIDSAMLGIHQFNPYRKLALEGVSTIATYLRAQGYRTVCLHPYHRSFYGREKVLPHLGFDEFVALEAFQDSDRDGPYTSDKAVGKKLLQLLSNHSERPIFLHVITMENHGPLHMESATDEDIQTVMATEVPCNCDDLVVYGRHLRNTDQMLGELRQKLIGRDRPTSLCFFGDHVPIMPKVYQSLGEPKGTTEYFLWHSKQPSNGSAEAADLSTLAFKFLMSSGWTHPSALKQP
ncbi:LTA synthase family protein [Alcaligenaceae bacterium B3P038]|nr:LTA synthase family protein [Alcaligenaceae bacterium B3P038]